ncbi:hypothetical protein L227DRAFT_102519 [Lentinus tigrinus ALCF2SS1-6]|uniref:Uncharacterized protein n=1 Tax=Lentinus tigrinus ALCF2SS1-6 TaxID=1328759 RepID=A0A5C2SBC1_9APHY|nr:hypothetical protein L227DRAFT_102519 [Lentinus tigrinus ALCF2SS1-6]
MRHGRPRARVEMCVKHEDPGRLLPSRPRYSTHLPGNVTVSLVRLLKEYSFYF